MPSSAPAGGRMYSTSGLTMAVMLRGGEGSAAPAVILGSRTVLCAKFRRDVQVQYLCCCVPVVLVSQQKRWLLGPLCAWLETKYRAMVNAQGKLRRERLLIEYAL